MTEELEKALRRTFKDAAERAPKAPPGIGFAPRSPRMHGRPSRMLLAVTAAAVAVAGTTIGGRALLNGTSRGTPPAKHVTSAPSPSLRPWKKMKVPAIEKVWPGVAVRVPKTFPNGRVFHPEGIIDDHTIAVTTDSSFEKGDAVYAYDLRTHATRQITTVVTPPGTKVFASGFTVGSGYVAWWLANATGMQIWAAPISGGPARVVAHANGGAPSQLTIDGRDVVWSPNTVGGVYRAPLAGSGSPRLVPGSASMHLLQWPWIGTPLAKLNTGSIRDNFGVAFAQVKNVVTGETRSARLTDRAVWQCGPTWCVGANDQFVTEAQRRDGSGRRAIPSTSLGAFSLSPPIMDRFVITVPSGGSVAVYDLRTGKVGDLRVRGNGGLVSATNSASRLYWTTTNGGYVIVDLGKI